MCVCACMYTLHVCMFTEEDARQAANANSRKRTLLDDIEKAMNGKWEWYESLKFVVVIDMVASSPHPPPQL